MKVFVVFILLALTIVSCQDAGSDIRRAKDRWVEGLKKMQRDFDQRDVMLSYYEKKWEAVCLEVLSEKKLKDLLNNPTDLSISIKRITELYDRAEWESRAIFYERFGFYPPEYFPPKLIGISGVVNVFNRVTIGMKWEEILKEKRITSAEDIPWYLNKMQKLKEKYKLQQAKYRASQLNKIKEILEAFQKGGSTALQSRRRPYINLRELPHISIFRVLRDEGITEARKKDTEIQWRLTGYGMGIIRKHSLLGVALWLFEKHEKDEEECLVIGPLIRGKYNGVTKVVEVGLTEKADDQDGTFIKEWVTLKVLEGVVYSYKYHKAFFPGDTVEKIEDDGDWETIKGSPRKDDLVGYHEMWLPPPDPGVRIVWEKIERSAKNNDRKQKK